MYCKLFSSLYQGTLRGRAHDILVFTNLLAHTDQHGYVDKHWRAIAEEVGLSIEEVKAACLRLESPDKESRSPELDGARLQRLDEHRAWGWRVVNFVKYRSIRDEETRREQNRIYQERWRKNNKPASAGVSRGKPESAQAEAEADTEAVQTPSVPRVHPDAEAVLVYLNEKAKRSFRKTEVNLKLISCRLREEGVDTAGVMQMIDRQVERWARDPKMAEFLRPETLFGKEKFDSYWGCRDAPATVQPKLF